MKNTSVPILLLLFSFIHCTNHIDKYQVSLDSLQTLPDGCYAYRRGSVYVEDVKNERYRIWYSLTGSGNIKDITQIDDFKNTTGKTNNDKAVVINKYRIDTVSSKAIAQRFIKFSRKFRFGLLKIDKKNEIFFSYKDGLANQYVMALHDSVKNSYLRNAGFTLLKNGWFENKKE